MKLIAVGMIAPRSKEGREKLHAFIARHTVTPDYKAYTGVSSTHQSVMFADRCTPDDPINLIQ